MRDSIFLFVVLLETSFHYLFNEYAHYKVTLLFQKITEMEYIEDKYFFSKYAIYCNCFDEFIVRILSDEFTVY